MNNFLRRKLRKGISFVAACAIMATNVSPWLVASYASEVPEEAYYEGADEYYEEASEEYFETPEVTMTPEAESADAYFEGSAEPTEAPSEAPDAADEAEYGLEETPDQEEAEVPDYEIDEMEDPDGDGIAEGVEAHGEMLEEDAFEEDAFENDASEDDAETPNGQILENAPSVIFEESTDEVRVTVVAGLGVFPEGTTMEVKPAEDEETISKVSESVEDERTKVTGVKAVDVTFYNAEHEEIEPNGPVFVTLEDLTKTREKDAEEPAQKPEEAKAVHVTDEGECSMMAAASEEDLQYLPMEWEEDQAEDSIKKIEQLNEEATVAFLAESFSTYALVYTVDFEYVDEEGKEYTWSFPGQGSYAIADIMSEIGVVGDIGDVSLECVEGRRTWRGLFLEERQDGLYLCSEAAFNEVYELRVTVNSKTHVITVTDEQVNERVTAEAYFLNTDGTRTDAAETESGKTLEAKIKLSNSSANNNEDAYIKLSLEGMDKYIRMNESFLEKQWDHITFRDMSTNQEFQIGVYYDPDQKCIVYKVPAGATGIVSLSFTTPNGITPDDDTLTLKPELVDSSFTHVEPQANDKIGQPVTGTWTSDFGWNPIQKYVNNVKENTVAVTKNASNAPVIEGWLRYDYSASSKNRAETGVRWTDKAVITDTLTLPEGMTFGGSYTVNTTEGRIYINDAPTDNNILFGLTLKENMKITDLQVVGNNKIEYTIEVDNPYTTRTDSYTGDLAREMDDISFTTELNASAITLASNTIEISDYGKEIVNKVNVTETPAKGNEQEKSSDQVKTVTKKDEGYKLDKTSGEDGKYVEADETIDYTIKVTNTGSVVIAAADSVITDSLPSAVYLTDAQKTALQQAVAQANSGASVTIDGNNLTIHTGDIAVGRSFTVTFNATVKDAKALKEAGYTNESTINNTAVYRGLSDYVASKVHMGEITPEKTSNLSVGKTLKDGETVQFMLTAKNTTAYDYKGDVYFYDDIPAYMKVKLYNSQDTDVTSTAYATPGTYNADPTPTYYVKDSSGALVPATITINNDGSIRVQVTKSNLTVSKNGGSYSIVLDATFDASKVNGNLDADGNVKYTNQVSINNNQAHTDVYGEVGKLGIDKYATDATYNGQGVSAPYIDGTVVSYKIHVDNDPAKPYKQDIVVTDTLPRGLFPVGLTVGGTVYTTWQDFVRAFDWQEKDATIKDASGNPVAVKAQQKYNSLQLTWTITNPTSGNNYVTAADITYKATVVNSDLVNRNTGIQDLVNKASVMGLSDDETIEIEVQGVNIDKKIVGKNGDEVSPCETILVSPGDSITYELTIDNPKHIATTVTGITDSMPFGGNGSPMPISWWRIGSTVSVDETTAGKNDFVTRSATYTNNDANNGKHYWLDNGYLKFGNIDITAADEKLVQRITLTYPEDVAALHSMFVGTNWDRTEKNTFSVDNLPPEDVTHTEPANKKYSIQKSVIGLAKDNSRLTSKDLFKQGTVKNVFYTVMVVNTGLTPLHLNYLNDILPAELDFVDIAACDYSAGSHDYSDREITTYDQNNNPNYVVPTGYVGLAGVKVLAVPNGNTVSFKLNDGAGVDIPEKTLLAFDVQCRLKNGVMLTDGQPITNTIQAALDSDAVLSKLPIKTQLTKDNSVQNNGDCEVVSNDGTVQIAESSVTIHPSNVAVPGILKQAVAYKEQSQGTYDANWTSITDKTVSINSQSKVKWKITLYNDGTVPINEGFKLEDNIYNHHVYESIESFKIYNAAGNATDIALTSAELNARTADNAQGFTTEGVGSYNHYTFTFPGGEKYTIPVGGRVELELVTSFTSGVYDGQLDNTAIFSPVQNCNYDCVIHGQREKNEEGTEYTGVSSMDYVNMLGSGATMSYKAVAPKSNPTQVAYGYDVSTGENYITVDDADELVTYTNHIQNLSNNTFAAFTLIDRMPEIGDTGVVNQGDRRNSEYTVDFADALNLKLAFRNSDGTSSIALTADDYTLKFSDKTSFGTEDWDGTAVWSDSPVGAKSFRLVLNSESLCPKINALAGSHLAMGVFPSKWVLEVSYDGKLSQDATAGQYAWNSFGYHYQTADGSQLSAEPPKVGVRIRPVPVLKKQVLDREGMDQGIDESVVFTFRFYEGAHTLTEVESLTPIWEPQVYQGQAVQLKPKRTVNSETTGHFEEGHVYTVVEAPADGYSLLDYEKNGLKQSTVGYCVFTYTNDQNTTIVCQNQLSGFAPEATKTLRARLPRTLQNEEFTFGLYPVSELDMENLGAVETVSATAAQTASNAANGAVNFDTLTYTEAGTYYYVMKEVPGSDTTVNYDDTSYLVKVDVVEQSGKFKATGSYYKVTASESDPIVSVQALASGVVPSFVNTESTEIQVEKVWAGDVQTGEATMVLYRTTGENAAVPTDKFQVTVTANTDNTPSGSAYITVNYSGDKGDSGSFTLNNANGWSKAVNLNRNEVYSFTYTPDGSKVMGVSPASTTGVSTETGSITVNATVKPAQQYTVTFTVPQTLKDYNDGTVTVTNLNNNETITFGKGNWTDKSFTVMEEDDFNYSVSVDGKFITNITNASGSFASVMENMTVSLGDFTTAPKIRNVEVSVDWSAVTDNTVIPNNASVTVTFTDNNNTTQNVTLNDGAWSKNVTLPNLDAQGNPLTYNVAFSPASAVATDEGTITYSGTDSLTGESFVVAATYTEPSREAIVTINVGNLQQMTIHDLQYADNNQQILYDFNSYWQDNWSKVVIKDIPKLVSGTQYRFEMYQNNGIPLVVTGIDRIEGNWYYFTAKSAKEIYVREKTIEDFPKGSIVFYNEGYGSKVETEQFQKQYVYSEGSDPVWNYYANGVAVDNNRFVQRSELEPEVYCRFKISNGFSGIVQIGEQTLKPDQSGYYYFTGSSNDVNIIRFKQPALTSNSAPMSLSAPRLTMKSGGLRTMGAGNQTLSTNGARSNGGASGSTTFADTSVGGSGTAFTAILAKDLPAGAEIVPAAALANSATDAAQATINGAGSLTWDNLPAVDADGHPYYYYVVEKDATANANEMSVRYSYAYNPDGSIRKVTITNTTVQLTGSLTVEKVVNGDNAKGTYSIAVKDASGHYYDTDGTDKGTSAFYVAFSKDQSRTWNNLPAGSYTVEEQNASVSGYDWNVTGDGNVTVQAGGTASKIVTNTYTPKPGALVITKKVKFNGAEATSDAQKAMLNKSFKFAVKNSSGTVVSGSPFTITVENGLSNTITVPGLPEGDYTIEETESNGLTLTNATGGTNVSPAKVVTVHVTKGKNTEETVEDTAKAEFTNNYETTDFEFSKIWNDIGSNPTTWPTGATITVTMNAYTDTSQKAIDDVQVTLSADGSEADVTPAWTAKTSAEGTVTTFKVEGLPKYKDGKELHYYVVETQVSGYKAPSYANSDGHGLKFTGSDVPKATNGQQIINTPEGGYELPSTGGPGTRLFTILGSILILGAGVLLWRRRRTI